MYSFKEVAAIYKNIEAVSPGVIMFRPVYKEEGNITELFYREGEEMLRGFDRRILVSVRQALARAYALDLAAQAENMRKKINRRALLPICLPDGRVFVPLKMRQPLVDGDSSYGYVDLAYVDSVKEKAGSVSLLLINGQALPLYSSIAAALNSIHLGKIIAESQNPPPSTDRETIIHALTILIDKIITR